MTKLPPLTPAVPKPKRLEGMSRARISQQMRAVLVAMVEHGLPVRKAAEQVGFSAKSAVRAFAKPHVKAAYNQMVNEVRRNSAQEAFLRVRELSQIANSEAVKLDANKWIAGIDGLSVVKRVSGQYVHSHHFGGFTYGRGGVSGYDDEIEGAANDG